MIAAAQQKAYDETAAAYKQRLEQCVAQMNQFLQNGQQQYEEFVQEYASQLKYLAVDIAKKWVGESIEQQQSLLEPMVMQTVGQVKEAKWMKVELSDKMQQLAEQIQKELEKSEFSGKAQVILTNTDPTNCIVHTDAGDIDASIETQAENLRKAFKTEE